MASACSIRVRGVVQGVGFRPFVYRLAQANTLGGWVLNGEEGVEIYLEGAEQGLQTFVHDLKAQAPPAANIAAVEVHAVTPVGLNEFTIRESQRRQRPTVRISPDLPVCAACLDELFDPTNPRYRYPYINCTNCGPRYTVIERLPYDRPNTTMKHWPLDGLCAHEYAHPLDRRFHAQPVACPACGPNYSLQPQSSASEDCIHQAVELLNSGKILAIKGLGGYHLACDARNGAAVSNLRRRKFRKEKPFAVMARNIEEARCLVELSAESEELLTSQARPIVLAAAKEGPGSPLCSSVSSVVSPFTTEGTDEHRVAPQNRELGVMLPYTPVHYLLFAAGAPPVLVMTSANRSSEPIAYEDDDAREKLAGIADAFLMGQRPIARRVDDSVVRQGAFGPVILRRARGYAPAAVATLPCDGPILALGADLKNSITLVVDGQAFVSQHIGDLEHYQAFRAFQETISDLLSMYEVERDELLVAHDAHPQYASSAYAGELKFSRKLAVQHHRAHVASVMAERGDWTTRVVGVSFDGTGYGDDGSIWGGEIFVGSIKNGFERVAHLRNAALAGGDAAAQHPVQAAAGFLAQLDNLPEMAAAPFNFPPRFAGARQLVTKQVRTFSTSSMGRLFDAVAALLGFTREISFEGQAAMWLEQIARGAARTEAYSFPFDGQELDFRPLLQQVIEDRRRGRNVAEIARAFHAGVAAGLRNCVTDLCRIHGLNTVALSGGVFQNELLLEYLKPLQEANGLHVYTNHAVPPNDGGISFGQAALAALASQNNEVIQRPSHA